MTEEVLRQYPAWREGLRRFTLAGFKAGEIVPHTWFFEVFEIEQPGPQTAFAEAEKAKFAYLRAIECLKSELLASHQIALDSVPGAGYRVVPPEEQTRWAEKEGIQDIKSVLTKMVTRVTNVDLLQLSSEQRAENADALARVSFLAGMLKQVKNHGHASKLLKDES